MYLLNLLDNFKFTFFLIDKPNYFIDNCTVSQLIDNIVINNNT